MTAESFRDSYSDGSSTIHFNAPTNCDIYPEDALLEATTSQLDEWNKRRNECCDRIQKEFPPNETHCELVWDTWDCWDWTAAGNTQVQSCPWWIPWANKPMMIVCVSVITTHCYEYLCDRNGRQEMKADWSFEINGRDIKIGNATRMCMPEGTWYVHPDRNSTWTNYDDCADFNNESPIRFIIFEAGYGTSVLALCLALFIFTYFQSLGCPRVTIHKNLFISFILSGISNIIWHVTIIASSASESETPCRTTYIMAQFFVLCNYFWMLSEGLYLHTVIVVAVFSENHDLLLYYIVGWVIPLVPTSVLLILQLTLGGGRCWIDNPNIEWVVGGTIIAVLLTNAGLLLNIVRVLVTKLRATPSQGARTYVRAVRATIILLPLMGLHYIIIPVRPSDNEVAELVYDCIIAFLISFQGFFVACIFCFFNGEVKIQIRRKWLSNWQLRRSSEFRSRHTTVTVTEAVSTTPPHSINLHQEKDIDNYMSHPVTKRQDMNGENGKCARKSVGFVDDQTGSDAETRKPLMLAKCDSEKTTVV